MRNKNDNSISSSHTSLTTVNVVILIFIVSFIVFGITLFNQFAWEDKILIIDNPLGHSFNIFDLNNTFNRGGQFRPIAALYSAVFYLFYNDIPFFYHFMQIVIHSANSVILFLLFQHYFGKKISLFLSLLFLIHPINSEAVSYVGAFNNPLFFLFGSSAFLLSLKHELSDRHLLAISGLLLLSILSKETGILFFFVIIIFQILSRRKTLIPLFSVSILNLMIYLFIRLGVGISFTKSFLYPIAKLTFSQRLINIPKIIFYYIKIILFPANLSTNQQWIVTNINFQEFYFPLIVDSVFFFILILLGFFLYKRHKKVFSLYLFFMIWFIVGLFLHLQLIPINMTVADHWLYFPIVGLLGILGIVLQILSQYKEKFKSIFVITMTAILVLLSVRTIIRNANWFDTISLFTHDSRIHDNYSIEDHLGIEYSHQKKYDEAVTHFEKSVALYPYEANITNLAVAYINVGNIQKAEESFNRVRVIHHKEKYLESIYLEISRFYINNRPPDKAREFIKIALQHYPDNGALWVYLAVSEYKLHNREGAL